MIAFSFILSLKRIPIHVALILPIHNFSSSSLHHNCIAILGHSEYTCTIIYTYVKYVVRTHSGITQEDEGDGVFSKSDRIRNEVFAL